MTNYGHNDYNYMKSNMHTMTAPHITKHPHLAQESLQAWPTADWQSSVTSHGGECTPPPGPQAPQGLAGCPGPRQAAPPCHSLPQS